MNLNVTSLTKSDRSPVITVMTTNGVNNPNQNGVNISTNSVNNISNNSNISQFDDVVLYEKINRKYLVKFYQPLMDTYVYKDDGRVLMTPNNLDFDPNDDIDDIDDIDDGEISIVKSEDEESEGQQAVDNIANVINKAYFRSLRYIFEGIRGFSENVGRGRTAMGLLEDILTGKRN